MKWNKLESVAQFNDLKMQSEQSNSAFVVFKHSTRCIVSKMALNQFSEEYHQPSPFYLINVIENREVSNFVADELSVTHQSPQRIVVKNGEVVHNSSHHSIDAAVINQVI
jgi:bacillithiol system protein YtxJ